MWNVIYEIKCVNIKFIYILSFNIFFLFQETPVNKNIQMIEASGRGYMVGIFIQWTISGFAWFTAFKYMFLLNLRHYKCFYCKSNLRNGFLDAWLIWKSGIVCVSMSLGSKVIEIINFRNSHMTKSKMAAKWTTWDINSPCQHRYLFSRHTYESKKK